MEEKMDEKVSNTLKREKGIHLCWNSWITILIDSSHGRINRSLGGQQNWGGLDVIRGIKQIIGQQTLGRIPALIPTTHIGLIKRWGLITPRLHESLQAKNAPREEKEEKNLPLVGIGKKREQVSWKR